MDLNIYAHPAVFFLKAQLAHIASRETSPLASQIHANVKSKLPMQQATEEASLRTPLIRLILIILGHIVVSQKSRVGKALMLLSESESLNEAPSSKDAIDLVRWFLRHMVIIFGVRDMAWAGSYKNERM